MAQGSMFVMIVFGWLALVKGAELCLTFFGVVAK